MYNKLMSVKRLLKLQNKWVAFSRDRTKIIDKASSLEKLLKKIKNQEDLVVSFIHPADRYLSP